MVIQNDNELFYAQKDIKYMFWNHFISISFLLHFYFIPNKEHHKINALLIQVLCAANHAAIRPDSRNYGQLAARSAALFFWLLAADHAADRPISLLMDDRRHDPRQGTKKKCRRLCRFSSKFLIFWSTSGTIGGKIILPQIVRTYEDWTICGKYLFKFFAANRP